MTLVSTPLTEAHLILGLFGFWLAGRFLFRSILGWR